MLVLECTVNIVGYRPNWKKDNTFVYLWTDIWKRQAYKLRKSGRNFRNVTDRLRLLMCIFSPLISEHVTSTRRWIRTSYSATFSVIRREKHNKSYIAVSLKRGAILQCETEGYSKRSHSHNNCSFRGKQKMQIGETGKRNIGWAV